MRFLCKTLMVATTIITLVSCQSTRQINTRSGSRSRTRTNNDIGTGRTLGAIAPLLGGLAVGRPTRFGPISPGGSVQSDPVYGGGYPVYGGYSPFFGGFPSLLSAFNPFAYRPRPNYPLYGGYNPYAYAGYQRPSPYGSYAGGSNGLVGSSSPSTNTGSTGASLGGGTSAGTTAAQAQIANQLGQALGASLRPLLSAGGGGGGAGGASGAGGAAGLASLLGLLG